MDGLGMFFLLFLSRISWARRAAAALKISFAKTIAAVSGSSLRDFQLSSMAFSSAGAAHENNVRVRFLFEKIAHRLLYVCTTRVSHLM